MSPSSSVADWRAPLLALLAGGLAACSGSDPAPAPEGAAIVCATSGADELADDCTLEKVRQGGTDILVVHHPDGGFRRLAVLPSGGLVTADGSEPARVTEQAEALAVTVGQDRYVVPRALIAADGQ